MKRLGLLCLISSALIFGACGDSDPSGIDKGTARVTPLADWPEDWCETQGWYGDGVCDEFCPLTDSDCETNGCDAQTPCDTGQVCDLQSCDATAVGTCVAEPEGCIEIYDPVCGCDGVTYGNDCERLAAGAALDHDGVCESTGDTCGGIAGLQCDTGEVCDIRMCALDGAGVCVAEPEACADIYDPVCGCDGVTYGNDCERLTAGAALEHTGACDDTGDECGGLAGTPCDTGDVCDIRMCADDAAGLCVPEPDGCIEIYDPVCGCDGVTYGNDCERVSAGAALDHEGEC